MANSSKTLGGPGRDQSGDRLDQSAEHKYIGDIYASPKVTIANAPDFTTSYKNPTDLATPSEAVIDCQKYDTMLVVVDYEKGAETDLRLRALFGRDDDEATITVQEDREDNSAAGVVAHEVIEHKWTATGRYYVYIKRTARFLVIEWKSTGATSAASKLAISVFGQNRER